MNNINRYNSIKDEFKPAEESIEWAFSAKNELYDEINNYFLQNHTIIVNEFDNKSGENVQKIKFTDNIPKIFRRKATEALNNAKHSFDQTVFAARNILSEKTNRGVNYPWAQNPKDLDRLLRERDIDPRLWDTIRAHEPYPVSNTYTGGDNLIRTLATIANNKHKLGLTIHGSIPYIRFPDITITGSSFRILNPQWNSLKNEVELIRWKGDIKINNSYEISFSLCINDSLLEQPVDVVIALHMFIQKAKDTCESVKIKCLELSR